MQPSIHAVPTRYEHLRPGYVDTCSASSRVLSIIPTGEHSLGKLWNLNLITALDTVKKGTSVLSTVTNHAISHSDKLSFSIKLALRINKGVVIPGNRNTLKSVREIND
nr:unnamed protein product [Callosobruchus chinensis]